MKRPAVHVRHLCAAAMATLLLAGCGQDKEAAMAQQLAAAQKAAERAEKAAEAAQAAAARAGAPMADDFSDEPSTEVEDGTGGDMADGNGDGESAPEAETSAGPVAIADGTTG